MLHTARTFADAKKSVVLIGNISDQLGRSRHDGFEIGHYLVAIDASRNALENDSVGDTFQIEMKLLEVAEHRRAVIQQIEIGSRECVRLMLHGIQTIRYLPILVQLESYGDRMVDHSRYMHINPWSDDVTSLIVQVIVSHKHRECINVIAHDRHWGVDCFDVPRILRSFGPREWMSNPIYGLKVHYIFGIVHDPVV